MKKILFVIESFDLNGANKSLISLLKTIDYSKYNVDVFSFIHRGLLISELPSEVNLLPEFVHTKLYKDTLKNAFKYATLKQCIYRLAYVVLHKTSPDCAQRLKRKIWMECSSIGQKYDLAVGYCEGESHLFVLNKTNADVKVGWIHVDGYHLNGDKAIYKQNFAQLDQCVVVSDDSKQSIGHVFDVSPEKIKVLHNIVIREEVERLSREQLSVKEYDRNVLNLYTIGRLSPPKKLDLAIQVAAKLKEMGYKFVWRVAGNGSEYTHLKELIEQNNVADCFVLLGEVKNPYPLLSACDIYIQPSEFEGWGLAVEEARILCKPIVVSDIQVFQEQIIDGVNGVVSKRTAEDLALTIHNLIDNPKKREELSNKLKSELQEYKQSDYIEELLS